jgi:hypothetical protein
MHRRERLSPTRRNEVAVQALAVTLYLALVAVGYGSILPVPWGAVARFIYDFQTLIAGTLALSSVAALMLQLRDQQAQHETSLSLMLRPELDGLALAARATAPTGEWGSDVVQSMIGVAVPFVHDISDTDIEYVRRHTHADIWRRLEELQPTIKQYNDLINSIIGRQADVEEARKLQNLWESIHSDREVTHLFAESQQRMLTSRYW